MRAILSAATLALLFAVSPAAAMMCGGQQPQASSSNTVTSGMMCGATGTAQDDPMADKPAQKPQQQMGMCPCCRNMAMMRGGASGMQHHNMPGMDMPKQ